MTVLERYKLYVEDLATALVAKIDSVATVEINTDEDIVLSITDKDNSYNVLRFKCCDYELFNETADSQDDWFHYIELSGINAFMSIETGIPAKYLVALSALNSHFNNYCKLHAADFVFKTTEFELVSPKIYSDTSTILLSPLSRKFVVSIMISFEVFTGYLGYITGLECAYEIQRKDEQPN